MGGGAIESTKRYLAESKAASFALGDHTGFSVRPVHTGLHIKPAILQSTMCALFKIYNKYTYIA